MGIESSLAPEVGAIRDAATPDAEATGVLSRRIHWILRVGAAMCFIGHGAFGIITKKDWLPFFAIVGIPEHLAYALMPVVGTVDIAAGIALLVAPVPAVLVYMTLWGFWTALLRPLTGDNIWETMERAGNYGVPFALLLLAGGREALRDWLGPIGPRAVPGRQLDRVADALRWTTALLLAGHGALGAFAAKPLLAAHYAVMGLPGAVVPIVGTIEIAVAVAVFTRPTVALLVVVALWKIASESLFLVAGAPVWEFIERGGSYAAPAALALLLAYRNRGADAARGDQ